jgi:transaldolase/glucose-6-phosphate isomerase
MEKANPLRALSDYGQSVWLDYIHRRLVLSGELQRLVEEDSVCGVTSNPSIFEKAVAGSTDYQDILSAADARHVDGNTLYERIVVRDIRDAADVLRPVYEHSQRRDGYVSLEVSPKLARDTQHARRGATLVACRRPAEPHDQGAGDAARRARGAAVDCRRYQRQCHAAVLAGRVRAGRRILAGAWKRWHATAATSRVASRQLFVSRIDSAVDRLLSVRMKVASSSTREQVLLSSLMGKIAIANAKQTYQKYLHLFSGPRWEALAARGAKTQRVLWASTGTKNPAYRDVVYVEELIGPDTVNTMPPATLDAFRDHGRSRASLTENVHEANAAMDTLAQLGISMPEVTAQLLDDGVRLFAEAFDGLLEAVDRRDRVAGPER